VQGLEPDLTEPVQPGPVAELLLERPGQVLQELLLGDLAALQPEQGVVAVASDTRCIPRPSCSIEMPVSSWKAANASISWLVSTPPKSLITARTRPAR
jgi:hypothetical protein